MKLTPEQKQFIKDNGRDWIVNGSFQGDDNDFSCIVSHFANTLARQGMAEAAVEITFKLQPEGFIHGSREDFLSHFQGMNQF